MGADVSQMIEVCARLKTGGHRVGAASSKALRKTAFDIEADAKTLAPIDTGNLRSSIATQFEGDGRNGVMEAVVTANAEYSGYVEFGTSTQSGQPFMVPAFERRLPVFEEALARIGATVLD